MRLEFSKVGGFLCLVLFFGLASVWASNVFVSENGISGNFISEEGNAGATFNLSVVGADGQNYTLVYENGLVVSDPVNGSAGNESNENGPFNNHTTLSNDLISYYNLNEVSGYVIDSHGSNDMTNYGATAESSGKINTAYSFDGSNDHINKSSFGSFPDAVTYSMWIYTSDPTAGIMQMFVPGTSRDSVFLSSGKILYESTPSSGSNDYWTTSGLLPTNQWVHLVMTNIGGSQTSTSGKIYFNGVLQTVSHSSAGADRTRPSGTPDFYLDANYDYSPNFAGSIDEVGIWGRALTSTEISDLYNNGDGLAYE